MILSRLSLRNFRNYEILDLSLKEGVNFFYGKNAEGKTNLLEACFYLSALNSPRAEKEKDLAKWGTVGFSLAGVVEKGEKEEKIRIDTMVTPNLRKRIMLNGIKVARSEILGFFPCVYFSPDDLYMVKGSSAMRRRFLDMMLSRASNGYSREIARYNQAVARRNRILKRLPDERSWGQVLEEITDLVVESGSAVLLKRLEIMEAFSHAVGRTYNFISGNGCFLSYSSSVGPLPPDKNEIKSTFKKALSERQREEIRRGVTLLGPHRDDLEITFEEKTFRYFGSQGEQRSVALALRLAEAAMLEERYKNKSALLLDDVLSELDESRRDKVLSLCGLGHQIFITSTDRVPFKGGSCHFFHVEKNSVTPKGHEG